MRISRIISVLILSRVSAIISSETLRLPVGLGSDRGGDVGAQLRERAAARGGKGVETGARDRLARARAARARVPARPLPPGRPRVPAAPPTRTRPHARDAQP